MALANSGRNAKLAGPKINRELIEIETKKLAYQQNECGMGTSGMDKPSPTFKIVLESDFVYLELRNLQQYEIENKGHSIVALCSNINLTNYSTKVIEESLEEKGI